MNKAVTHNRHTVDLDKKLSAWVTKRSAKNKRSISAEIEYLCEEQKSVIEWNEKSMKDKLR